MLPTPTPDDAGDASFLGPSRAPTQKADMGSRARARGPRKSSPKRAARKPARKRKCNKTPYIAAFWVARTCARAPEGPKTNGKKARTAQLASQPQQKQNGQNNSQKSSF